MACASPTDIAELREVFAKELADFFRFFHAGGVDDYRAAAASFRRRRRRGGGAVVAESRRPRPFGETRFLCRRRRVLLRARARRPAAYGLEIRVVQRPRRLDLRARGADARARGLEVAVALQHRRQRREGSNVSQARRPRERPRGARRAAANACGRRYCLDVANRGLAFATTKGRAETGWVVEMDGSGKASKGPERYVPTSGYGGAFHAEAFAEMALHEATAGGAARVAGSALAELRSFVALCDDPRRRGDEGPWPAVYPGLRTLGHHMIARRRRLVASLPLRSVVDRRGVPCGDIRAQRGVAARCAPRRLPSCSRLSKAVGSSSALRACLPADISTSRPHGVAAMRP